MAAHINKTDKARIIIQALYNLPHCPARDDRRVRRMARKRAAELDRHYELARKILADRDGKNNVDFS